MNTLTYTPDAIFDIVEKIKSGGYKNKLPVPSRLKDPKGWKEYRDEDKRLHQAFRQDLRKYFESPWNLGPLTDEQADKLFNFVWSQGHASGFHEVIYWTDEIMDLIKVFKK